MIKKKLTLFLVCLSLAILPKAEAQEVLAAAAGIAPCIEEVMELYVSDGNEPLSIVKGPCGALARQTEAGAPFGVIMMAEPRWPRWMEEKGLLTEKATFATGQLVLWSKDSKKPDLAGLSQHKTAIPQPDATAYGMAAKDHLQKKGLWDNFMKGDILMVNSAPQGVLSVKKGTCQWAFVPLTAALKSGGSYLIMDGATLPQVGGLTQKAGPNSRSFWNFCLSHKTDPIWEKWGLTLEGRP